MLMQTFLTVLGKFWWVIPILLVLAYLKSPSGKGSLGEALVNVSARLFLDKSTYHLIKNVTLPTEDGTTQVDHIIVSPFGIFVIETKNYAGWIFGGVHQKVWTQKIYRRSHQFQNPIHQNYKHVQTLKRLLDVEGSVIHSLIVFVGDSTFKTPMPDNVTKVSGYLRFIRAKTTRVLAEQQVIDIVGQIKDGRLQPSFRTNREHVRHVVELQAAKAVPSAPAIPAPAKITSVDAAIEICPKCGKSLVGRTVKRGANMGATFVGCSGYPACRYVLKDVPAQQALF